MFHKTLLFNSDDCGTLRGITVKALKKNEEIVEKLQERIVGRTSLDDVYDPITEELLVSAGEHINESIAKKIETSPIESVEVRSPLTCEAKTGICAKCLWKKPSYRKKWYKKVKLLELWLLNQLVNQVHN